MPDNKPPSPLLPYNLEIDFHPQQMSIADKSVSSPASMPFYYASFVGIWVYWLTDVENVMPHFSRGHFKPYTFTDGDGCGEKALVVINFQTYTSHAGMALGTVNEVEFNICAYPTCDEDRIPMGLSVNEFMMGIDQTKRIGLFRIHVPADNTIAVAAGKGFFGEPKFFAQFDYMIPCLNLPGQTSWNVSVYDQSAQPLGPDAHSDSNLVFSLNVPEINATPAWANTSPLALYTYVDGVPNGSHWQMLLPMESYYPLSDDVVGGIKMKAGKSDAGLMPETGTDNSMAHDIAALIGDNKAVGVQIFRSNPSCIEGGPFEIR
jgi:hypothetical protein